jgi:hypothetical protein
LNIQNLLPNLIQKKENLYIVELDNSDVNLQDTFSQLDSNTSITSFKMKNCLFGKMKEFGEMKFTNKNLLHLDLSSTLICLISQNKNFKYQKI